VSFDDFVDEQMADPEFASAYRKFSRRIRWQSRLRRAWRVLTRDPELRPGRIALRDAVFRTTPVGKLVTALESGGYNHSHLVPGSELKLEDLSSVMLNVTFDETHLRLQRPVADKVDHAALRERRCRSDLP